MDKQLYTPTELVARWNGVITFNTLANWRARGRGPAFLKLGSKVVYPHEAVVAYEQQNLQARAA